MDKNVNEVKKMREFMREKIAEICIDSDEEEGGQAHPTRVERENPFYQLAEMFQNKRGGKSAVNLPSGHLGRYYL